MTRKTKVRIVGDPELVGKVADVVQDHCVTEKTCELDYAAGRSDYGGNQSGRTIYLLIKRPKEGAELEETP